MKNKKRSENKTIDKELERKAWRNPETNVLYSIHCTVQYHDGAIKKDRVDFSAVVIKVNTGDHDSKDRFVDTDIEGSLMIDVLKIEIHGNNGMRTNFTPDQKYCSHMQNESQITTKEDKADFSTVVTKVSIDGNKGEGKFVDIKKSLIVDGLETEVYEIDCMGTHLTPTCTGLETHYSNIPNGSQDIATVEGDSISIGLNVDREVDTDGDRTVPVLQWLERKATERSQYQANSITSPSVYFVIQEIETGSAPRLASSWSVEETPTLHSCAVSSLSVLINNRQSLPVKWTSSRTSTPTTGCMPWTPVQEHEEDVSLHPRTSPPGS